MGFCTDSAVSFLNGNGYNVVRHPRAGIDPLMLVGRQRGDTSPVGTVEHLVVSRRGRAPVLPKLTRDMPSADISGTRSSKLDVSIGLSVLEDLVKAFGGSLGISAQFATADTISFEFSSVLSDSIVPADLGDYLANARLNMENSLIRGYLLGDGDLFVITHTVKSSRFHVAATNESNSELKLDVPAIQKAVGGKLNVSVGAERETLVTFAGTVPLVFGFKCLRVGIESGRVSLVNQSAKAPLAFSTGHRETFVPALLKEEGRGLLDLAF